MNRARWLVLGGALLLSACAWTRRENRPVWNAFEATLVPESDLAFYATLPLTIPVGVGAILVDTLVAHPVQVVDDAFDDTCELWRDLDFEGEFYSESALLPARAAASPLWFLGSFLGRSAFDWPTHAEAEQRAAAAATDRRRETLQWLAAIAAAGDVSRGRLGEPYDDELRAAVAKALAAGGAHGRLRVYEAASRCSEPEIVDWNAALADPSGVVRHRVVDLAPSGFAPADAVRARLLADPDEAVRERAARRWGR